MKKYISSVFLLVLCFPLSAAAQKNTDTFVSMSLPHPICGINPSFTDQPRNIPVPPFASCRTLAAGYGADKSYPDPGIDALSKLIVALAETTEWDKRFGPLSKPQLLCTPAMPLGLGPPPGSPQSSYPTCTVSLIQSFLRRYNAQPVVKGFKEMESAINLLDLKQKSSIDKLRQAAAVVRSSGGNVTFDEVAELLQ